MSACWVLSMQHREFNGVRHLDLGGWWADTPRRPRPPSL